MRITDFKSVASADFATRAHLKQTTYEEQQTFTTTHCGEFVGSRLKLIALMTGECPISRIIVNASAPALRAAFRRCAVTNPVRSRMAFSEAFACANAVVRDGCSAKAIHPVKDVPLRRGPVVRGHSHDRPTERYGADFLLLALPDNTVRYPSFAP